MKPVEANKEKQILNKYSALTGLKLTSKDYPLYSFIDDWYGVPHRQGGTTKTGVDCSGFTGNLYREIYKKDIPRSSIDQWEKCNRVGRNGLKQGDLVFFDIEKGKKVSHVGVYLGNNKFVHASTSKGVRIDDLESDYYKKYFKSGGRF